MINPTPLVRPYFRSLAQSISATSMNAESSQMQTLRRLIDKAHGTKFGESHCFKKFTCLDDFKRNVPIVEYPALRESIMEMVAGKANILWPGKCNRFAQSSGTSDGKSKFIPLTHDSLRLSHYRGGADVVALYLSLNPNSKIFCGKSFILGGSFANELSIAKDVKVGDLSAHLIDKINPLANIVRIPSKQTALVENWAEKLPRLVDEAIGQNVTNISGVPSWFLTVLKKILEKTGADNISEIWPNLEVFFHGGIAFSPYINEYRRITSPSTRYLETYNASEGFFAVADNFSSNKMLLLHNVATFYEFLPLEYLGEPNPPTLCSWQVEPGKIYALVITAPNGLWRYLIGDTVKIESTNPLRISIAGRTKSYINAFGEELMVYNADAALAKTCQQTHAVVANYTVAPLYSENGKKGAHQWFIDFTKKPECGIDKFADVLDEFLTKENSDYQAKREGNIFLDRLKIVEVGAEIFDKWLSQSGKLGGQRKIPRLSNDRRIADALICLINT